MFDIPRIIFFCITQRLGKKIIYGQALANSLQPENLRACQLIAFVCVVTHFACRRRTQKTKLQVGAKLGL